MSGMANKPGTARVTKSPTVVVTVTAVMIAFVFVVTFFLSSPIPGLGGQAVFDAGDISVFIASLSFGPIVGAIAGGIGSGLSDAVGGSYFAPFTFVIKGLEGLFAGLIAIRSFRRSELIGWGVGSVVMVAGYFMTNYYLLTLFYGAGFSQDHPVGLAVALGELPFDVAQVVAGGIIGIPVARKLRAMVPVALLPHRGPKPLPSGSS
jgi:uncharacterized membrane protein